ncbi:type IV pilin-like G/H family protein [Pantanalinema rosaneae CENA516]|uniref:type IV pilin-like G/H family protein n=1 Tax=Pantanalinema rosaneae TaxID=1620701 RepID=UPI003D6F4875
MNWLTVMAGQRSRLEQGISTWEILVLIVGLGILGAIAIPLVLTQTHRHPVGAEGRTSVGAINRAQQAYFLEHQRFAESLPVLGIGTHSQTRYYTYRVQVAPNMAVSYGMARQDQVEVKETHDLGLFTWDRTVDRRPLKSFVGAVVPTQTLEGVSFLSRLCEKLPPHAGRLPAPPVLQNGTLVCATGTMPLD